MRQRIDLEKLHGRAVKQIAVTVYGGKAARAPPVFCPVTLDQLLEASCAELEAAFATAAAGAEKDETGGAVH